MTDMQLDQGKNLFLFLVPGKDQPQADYMWTAIREVIVPSAMRVRDQIVIRDARRASSTSGDAPLKRIVLTFDGEHEHLTATLDLLVDKVPEEWKGLGVELLKYAASASKHQQPCDVSCCYSVLKQAEKLLEELSPPAYHDEVESLLEVNLSGASARTYTRFLSRLPDLLSKALWTLSRSCSGVRRGISSTVARPMPSLPRSRLSPRGLSSAEKSVTPACRQLWGMPSTSRYGCTVSVSVTNRPRLRSKIKPSTATVCAGSITSPSRTCAASERRRG